MRRLLLLVLLLAAAFAGGSLLSHRSQTPAGPGTYKGDGSVTIATPEAEGNGVGLRTRTVEVPRNREPIKSALESLLEYHGDRAHPNALPEGTRLLGVNLRDGVVTVDLSREFNALREGGDTGESLAQNALRKTLAQFPQVQRMRVLVEGKPFESEHTDWTEPIPVRDEDAQAGGVQ